MQLTTGPDDQQLAGVVAAMDEPTFKKCSRCSEVKAAPDFNRDRKSADGLSAWCRECSIAYKREWRNRNPDYGKQYYAKNREKVLAQQAERKAEDPDAWREKRARQKRERYARNPEPQREWARKWRAADPSRRGDPEKNLARLQAWIEEQKAQDADGYRQRVREMGRAWARRHPERAAEKVRRRRAIKIAATVGPVSVEALWTGRCGICGLEMSRDIAWPHPESKSLDHIVPLSKGGSHTQDNLQWAHLRCNLKKGATAPTTQN